MQPRPRPRENKPSTLQVLTQILDKENDNSKGNSRTQAPAALHTRSNYFR